MKYVILLALGAALGCSTQQPATAAPPRDGKRVLLVLANDHFFYREYADPKAELEKAGLKVTVAAGRKGVCKPHDNSGQTGNGHVQAEVALADVKVDEYDAVLFAGGYGASMYQYAFTGRYNEATYNGNANIKAAANKIINDFLAKEKHVAGLCNGVSVLAWARVNGKSPLEGKKVCCPTLPAPAGVYNGQQGQPSCRWHAEQNKAVLLPAGSVGRSNTAADDVSVDGLIITGQDDSSARELGRRLAEVLTKK